MRSRENLVPPFHFSSSGISELPTASAFLPSLRGSFCLCHWKKLVFAMQLGRGGGRHMYARRISLIEVSA